MRSLLRGTLLSLLLTGVAHSQAGPPPGVRTALEGTFSRCGLHLVRSAHLDRVAAAYARLGTVKQAAAVAGYAYQKMQGLRMNGPLSFIVQSVGERCVEFREAQLIAYGVAPYGRGYALIVADPRIPPNLRGPSTEGKALLNATNAVRAKGADCGGKWMPPAPPLAWDDRLFAAAQLYAQRLATLNFTGHIDPYTGQGPQDRAQRVGFRGAVGENLQHGRNTALLAVQSLVTSPGHCENMLDPRWTVMGGSYWASENSNYGIHWVQLFGRF
ncbi:CAP domain-containing protein [Deinococcus aetherius]|nr:CAP domain-containing protein [Deinococcus aetherius]